MQKEMNDTVRQSARLRAEFFDKLSNAIRFAGFAFEKGCVPLRA